MRKWQIVLVNEGNIDTIAQRVDGLRSGNYVRFSRRTPIEVEG